MVILDHARILVSLGKLSKILEHILLLTEAPTSMFLENKCTFYDRQIILLKIVFYGIPEFKMPKLSSKDISKKLGKLKKTSLLRDLTNSRKNSKN